MRIEAEIENTRAIVLNDMGNSFTPLFDYEMDSIKVLLVKNNLYQTIDVFLPFKLSNYNPLTSKWEPIIEKTGFVINMY